MRIQRGRPSAESLAFNNPIPGQRPEPPDFLSQEEAAEWRAIAERLPADWFPAETLPTFVELVQAIAMSRQISREMRPYHGRGRLGPDLEKYIELVRVKCQLASAVARNSTKLRLCQSTRMSKQTAYSREQKTRARPWDIASFANGGGASAASRATSSEPDWGEDPWSERAEPKE